MKQTRLLFLLIAVFCAVVLWFERKMKQIKAFAVLLALLPLATLAQEERIDTVIPKFLSNGYFFREMPALPDGEKTMSRLKDKEGNSVIVINVDATLPKSLIRKAIPREQVHNADQFLNGLNMMATVTSLTQAGVKADGTWYSPKVGEPFPQFSEKDMDGRTWTNDSVKGRVMVINLWYSGCGPCRAEMPILSECLMSCSSPPHTTMPRRPSALLTSTTSLGRISLRRRI